MERLGFSTGSSPANIYNNFGNIEARFDYWAGLTGETYGKNNRFASFDSKISGMRAPLRDIKTKIARYKDSDDPIGHAIAEYLGGGRQGSLEEKISRATGKKGEPNYNPDVRGYINDVKFLESKKGDKGILEAIGRREGSNLDYYFESETDINKAIELSNYDFKKGSSTNDMLRFLQSIKPKRTFKK